MTGFGDTTHKQPLCGRYEKLKAILKEDPKKRPPDKRRTNRQNRMMGDLTASGRGDRSKYLAPVPPCRAARFVLLLEIAKHGVRCAWRKSGQ
jgi:hypothetical protein